MFITTSANSDFFIFQQHWIALPDGSLTYNYHGEGVEARPGQQVSQVGDGGEGRHVRGEAALPLQLGQLQRAAQLVQRVPAQHGPDEHPVRLQHLVDLQTHAVLRLWVSISSKEITVTD